MWSGRHSSSHVMICPSLASTGNRCPSEESALLPLLNAGVIRSVNPEPIPAGDELGLIRKERGYTSKGMQRLTSSYWQEPGRRAREYMLMKLNQRGKHETG